MKLILINFRCHSRKEVDLNPGMTCFRGPSGSGKSTILTALMWVLYGKERNVIPEGSKERTVVELTCKEFTIRRQKKPEKVEINFNGNVLMDDQAQTLIDLIFLPYDLFKCCSVATRDDRNIFMTLSQMERNHILELLSINDFNLEAAHQRINEEIKIKGEQKSKYELDIAVSLKRLEEFNEYKTDVDLNDLNERLKNEESNVKRLEEINLVRIRNRMERDYHSKKIVELKEDISNLPSIDLINEQLNEIERVIRWIGLSPQFKRKMELENELKNSPSNIEGDVNEQLKSNITLLASMKEQDKIESLIKKDRDRIENRIDELNRILESIPPIREIEQRLKELEIEKERINLYPQIKQKQQLEHKLSDLDNKIKPIDESLPFITSDHIQQLKNNIIVNNLKKELSISDIEKEKERLLDIIKCEEIIRQNEYRKEIQVKIKNLPPTNVVRDALNGFKNQLILEKQNKSHLRCPKCDTWLKIEGDGLKVCDRPIEPDPDLKDKIEKVETVHGMCIERDTYKNIIDNLPVKETTFTLSDVNDARKRLDKIKKCPHFIASPFDSFSLDKIVDMSEQQHLRKQREEIRIQLQGYSNLSSEIVDEPRMKDVVLSEERDLRRKQSDHQTFSSELQTHKYSLSQLSTLDPCLKEKIDECERKIKTLEHHINYERMKKEYDTLMKQLGEFEREYIVGDGSIECINRFKVTEANRKKELIDKISKIKIIKSLLNNHEENLSKLSPYEEDLTDEIETIKRKNKMIEGNIKYKTLEKEYLNVKSIVEPIIEEIKHLYELREELFVTENNMYQNTIDQINGWLQQICSSIFERPIIIGLSLIKTAKTTGRSKPNIHLDISYGGNSYDSSSSGEKDRVALALTVALFKVSGSKFLLLDEIPVSLGWQKRDDILKKISQLTDGYIVSIVHDESEQCFQHLVDF